MAPKPKKRISRPAPIPIPIPAQENEESSFPSLPPELIERVFSFLPTALLVRLARLSKADLTRTPARLKQRFREHFYDNDKRKHLVKSSFACGWGYDSEDSDVEEDEARGGAFVLNAMQFQLASEEPWIGDFSGPNEFIAPLQVLDRGRRAVQGADDFYRSLPILLPETPTRVESISDTPSATTKRKAYSTFRQLVRSYFNSMRIRMVPEHPFRVFTTEARYAPSSLFVALVDDVTEGPPDPTKKQRRTLSGNPGWWDEFQVVEPDKDGTRPAMESTVSVEQVAEDSHHVGLGIVRPVSDLLGHVSLTIKELDKMATPKGSFVIPLPVSDFCPEERRRFAGIQDGLTFRGWAGPVTVANCVGKSGVDPVYWVVEIREMQVGLMAMARKVDLEERAAARVAK